MQKKVGATFIENQITFEKKKVAPNSMAPLQNTTKETPRVASTIAKKNKKDLENKHKAIKEFIRMMDNYVDSKNITCGQWHEALIYSVLTQH